MLPTTALPTTFSLGLPEWVDPTTPPPMPALADRMRLVLQLAAANVRHATGGPFAAAVFEREGGALVSVGVNRVMTLQSSLAHAEVLALGLAHVARATFDLGQPGMPRLQLVSSSQMCAMCLGAVVWSGVSEVVYATTARDVISTVGFDEGPTPVDYADQLALRRIAVVPEVLREEGLAVLQAYVDAGGVVYNAHH